MGAFENWSGDVSFRPAKIAKPRSIADVQRLVRAATAARRSVRVAGAGHSFTPLIETEGVLVSLDRLRGIESIDSDALEATVFAGTRLYELGPALAKAGYAMENLGDIDRQSIAGAVSTGTHGTGRDFGSLSTQVTGFELVLASGERLWCDRDAGADVFAAGRVALGTLGILTRVRVRIVPLFRLRLARSVMPIEEALASAAQLIERHRNFEFYWFPYTGRVATKAWDVTNEAGAVSKLARYVDGVLLENTTFGLLCDVVRRFPALIPSLSKLIVGLSGSGSTVDISHKQLTSPRYVRFNEMEYALPAERAPDAFREFVATFERERFPVFFPVEYRWVKGDDIWLSPAYGRDTVTISIHQDPKLSYAEYFEMGERIFRKHGGRPHWGKIHTLRANDLRGLYPQWDSFATVRRQLDPQGRFTTPYLRALLESQA